MDYQRYIARKRARFNRIGGEAVNIPYGTPIECKGGRLFLDGKQLCSATSRISHEYFCQDDDGLGKTRGALVEAILSRLEKRDNAYQLRWDSVWSSPCCQQYRRPEHEDRWLWNHAFFNAPVEDLRTIAALVGAKIKS